MINLSKELLAEYGQRCLEAEIANAKLQECKQRVAAELGRKPEVTRGTGEAKSDSQEVPK